jgi:hypothetical protein
VFLREDMGQASLPETIELAMVLMDSMSCLSGTRSGGWARPARLGKICYDVPSYGLLKAGGAMPHDRKTSQQVKEEQPWYKLN